MVGGAESERTTPKPLIFNGPDPVFLSRGFLEFLELQLAGSQERLRHQPPDACIAEKSNDLVTWR